MRLIRFGFLGAVFLASVFLFVAGCSQQNDQEQPTNKKTGSIANKICPMMGGKVDAEGETVQWDGKTVGFCCPDCLPEWNKLSDAEKQKKWDAAKAKAEDNKSKDS